MIKPIAETDGNVMQDEVVQRIISKMPNITRVDIYNKGWLDIESMYRKAGWKVTYDKPGYNESYQVNWKFVSKG